jgi:tetratricopeptide (TPR) repeat protein
LNAFQVPPEKIPLNLEDQAALYRSLVEGKRLVIVLDNARDTDQVLSLLPGSPTCMVLVTSRRQLGSLITLKRALHITLELMNTAEARQLINGFLEPASRLGLQRRIYVKPDEVYELTQLCSGLPMALSIATARILLASPHLPLTTLVDQLREEHQRLDVLSTGDNQLTDLRAVLSWSYNALSPRAARLFRLLGLHPGPHIDIPAAASLADLPAEDADKLIAELTLAHLLKEYSPGRYQLHDLLRTYAAEQVTMEQRQAALHRLLGYYLYTGCPAVRHLNSPWKADVFSGHEQVGEWFAVELTPLLEAIDRATDYGINAHGWHLPRILTNFINRQGHCWHDNACTLQQTTFAVARQLGDRGAQTLTFYLFGHLHAYLGSFANALSDFLEALTRYQDSGDRIGQARTHLTLSLVYERQSQHGQALVHCRQALSLYRALGECYGEACALYSIGNIHHATNDCPAAQQAWQQALTIFDQFDHIDNEPICAKMVALHINAKDA